MLLSVVTSMVGCNQTIAIMMTEQLGCVLYKEQENSQRAVDLEDSAVLIAALIPWSIAGAVPAATIGAPVLLSCSGMLSVFNSDLSTG